MRAILAFNGLNTFPLKPFRFLLDIQILYDQSTNNICTRNSVKISTFDSKFSDKVLNYKKHLLFYAELSVKKAPSSSIHLLQ